MAYSSLNVFVQREISDQRNTEYGKTQLQDLRQLRQSQKLHSLKQKQSSVYYLKNRTTKTVLFRKREIE